MKIKHNCLYICLFVICLIISNNTVAEGNRFGDPRNYHSEISAAKAYLLTNHDQGNVTKSAFSNAVIIDVRTVEEYRAGHPPKAFNIPFPHIQSRPNKPDYIKQEPQDFVNAVISAFPDRNTPIFTLCQTGKRSIGAANLLAAEGYINVRNIWQGFSGRTKTDVNGSVLDLNNNGVIDGINGTDPGDRDGWSGYQELPVHTKLLPKLIYEPYQYLYYQ